MHLGGLLEDSLGVPELSWQPYRLPGSDVDGSGRSLGVPRSALGGLWEAPGGHLSALGGLWSSLGRLWESSWGNLRDPRGLWSAPGELLGPFWQCLNLMKTIAFSLFFSVDFQVFSGPRSCSGGFRVLLEASWGPLECSWSTLEAS